MKKYSIRTDRAGEIAPDILSDASLKRVQARMKARYPVALDELKKKAQVELNEGDKVKIVDAGDYPVYGGDTGLDPEGKKQHVNEGTQGTVVDVSGHDVLVDTDLGWRVEVFDGSLEKVGKREARIFKFASISQIPAEFESLGTGMYRKAHSLWRLEKDGEAFVLVRAAEEKFEHEAQGMAQGVVDSVGKAVAPQGTEPAPVQPVAPPAQPAVGPGREMSKEVEGSRVGRRIVRAQVADAEGTILGLGDKIVGKNKPDSAPVEVVGIDVERNGIRYQAPDNSSGFIEGDKVIKVGSRRWIANPFAVQAASRKAGLEPKYKVGDNIEVILDAAPDEVLKGKVKAVDALGEGAPWEYVVDLYDPEATDTILFSGHIVGEWEMVDKTGSRKRAVDSKAKDYYKKYLGEYGKSLTEDKKSLIAPIVAKAHWKAMGRAMPQELRAARPDWSKLEARYGAAATNDIRGWLREGIAQSVAGRMLGIRPGMAGFWRPVVERIGLQRTAELRKRLIAGDRRVASVHTATVVKVANAALEKERRGMGKCGVDEFAKLYWKNLFGEFGESLTRDVSELVKNAPRG